MDKIEVTSQVTPYSLYAIIKTNPFINKGIKMRTLTLKISDDYFDKFVAFLEMLPKKTIEIETIKQDKELDILQKNIKKAMSDIKEGRSKTIRVVD